MRATWWPTSSSPVFSCQSAACRRREHGHARDILQRHDRKETERFKSFTYEELFKRDKINLDIFWLKTNASKTAPTSDPGVIALEITEDLEATLAQFAEIASDLKR